MNVDELLKKQPILLYDGECGFCNKFIQFFLRYERKKDGKGVMHFAPLQSPTGIALRRYFDVDDSIDSIILIRNHDCHIKSCAALRMSMYMNFPWPLAMVFVIIPPFIRNRVYDFIAKRRMKLYGRVDSCEVPSPEARARFFSV